METVLIVIHLIIVVAMAGVILLQRSEGGALGIGGGGGGNFMSGRGKGDVLTKTTSILALCFFLTSIGLSILANYSGGSSILDRIDGGEGGIQPLAPQPLAPQEGTPQTPTITPLGPQVPTAE